jgi:hypothetical protein
MLDIENFLTEIDDAVTKHKNNSPTCAHPRSLFLGIDKFEHLQNIVKNCDLFYEAAGGLYKAHKGFTFRGMDVTWVDTDKNHLSVF